MAQVCLPPGWVTEHGGICAVGTVLDANGFAVGCPDPVTSPVGATLVVDGTQMIESRPPVFPADYEDVLLPTVNHNYGGIWNAGLPNKLTIPVSGIYLVQFLTSITTYSDYRSDSHGVVTLNGNYFIGDTDYHTVMESHLPHGMESSAAITYLLAAGDVLGLKVNQQTFVPLDPTLNLLFGWLSVWLLNRL